MKLTAARVAAFLAAPDPAIRAALVFGPDQGLVRERADRIAAAIVPDRNDPFRIADLAAATLAGDPARLDDEARALSLMPGRRLVRVRDAGDALAGAVRALLRAEAAGRQLRRWSRPATSPLARRCAAPSRGRSRARPSPAIPTARDELRALVRSVMAQHRVTVAAEAADYLAEHLGGDRMMSRQEIEKLALYAGDGGAVDLDAARAVVGDSAEITVDDAIHAAAAGDCAMLERCLGRAFDEGEAAVTVLRAAIRHFQRLYLASARQAAGASAAEAIASLRPPLFYKARDTFAAELSTMAAAPRHVRARGALRGRAQRQAHRPAARGGVPRRAAAHRPRRPATPDRMTPPSLW